MRHTAGFEIDAERPMHELDDDERPKRTGTAYTATAHIITSVIGSGVLSLAWATAQLGWVVGATTLFLFSVVTLYTSSMLTDCYRIQDPVNGTRNYTYMDAVTANLGRKSVWLCGLCQYVNLFGSGVGYTISSSISAVAVMKSNCYHKRGHDANCRTSDSMYMVVFGFVQIILSQLPDFHDLWWISIIAATMSFMYSSIAVGLSLSSVISGKTGKTTITGTEIGVDVEAGEKVWKTCQALGNIAFAYSYSMVLIEIQDTLKSPPAENKVMKRANLMSILITTSFYALAGLLGYAAFGNNAPGNILTGFYDPYWLVDLANAAIILHLVGAYQVFLQPLFAAVETCVAKKWPNLNVSQSYTMISSKNWKFNINVFRLTWRTAFVVVVTFLAILMPFFNDVLAFLGAAGFWPLTVYFPVEMYIAQKQIARYTRKWMFLQTLSFVCFMVSLAAACGSIQGMAEGLQNYTPFQTQS